MSNYEATRFDFDGANITGIEGIPTATIRKDRTELQEARLA